MIGAIGIVFGDIGTSPLYALQSVFHLSGLTLGAAEIQGVISLILWSITLIVTVKYISILMNINNHGEGGIMALLGLIRQSKTDKKSLVGYTLIGIIGVALFCGDGVITPAISVLSSVEGLSLVSPNLSQFVIPVALVVLAILFYTQSRGTGALGKLFGPVMIMWFVVSAIGGLGQIIAYPDILISLLPTTALGFITAHPTAAFVGMGAVILAMTGAEALYADLGHFGKRAIRMSWLILIFPALALTYMGQGALISHHPEAITSAYYLMFPNSVHIPIIVLATLATLIASQAVIAGIFSLTWQAIRLDLLPRLGIRHTSRQEAGQVYVPVINWSMFIIIVLIIFGFRDSSHLASMYGLAVSGTLLVDSIFMIIVLRRLKHVRIIYLALIILCIMSIEVVFISSGLSKLLYGAWVALLISALVFLIINTWYKGHTIIKAERKRAEGNLIDFVEKLRGLKVKRIRGAAVYISHNTGSAPIALHETIERLHELHNNVIIVTVRTLNHAHVPEAKRLVFDELGHGDDGISHVTVKFGYKDIPNVPRALEQAREAFAEINFNSDTVTYFTSAVQPAIVKNKRMATWRKHLYVFLDRSADEQSLYYRLPINQTVELRTFLEL